LPAKTIKITSDRVLAFLSYDSKNMSEYDRIPAKVLACLRTGEITVIIFPSGGMGTQLWVLPVGMVPFSLRIPNSEFDIIMGFDYWLLD
jgi:hypothetical protein